MFHLAAAIKYLKESHIDAWLLYDFRGCNYIAHRILGQAPIATRRYFLIIEPESAPIVICNILDKPQFEFCKFTKFYYTRLEEMLQYLKQHVSRYRRIITEYSPSAAIPSMSIIDAGTYELLKKINPALKILSSADCYQLVCGSWEADSLQKHYDACQEVDKIKEIAFCFLKNSIMKGMEVTEYDVQQVILKEFADRGLITEDVPVVAVNENSSDPHYEPSETLYREIKKGDWVLIDLWAKFPEASAVFADITWVGYMGDIVPNKYIQIFEIVKEMRDGVVRLLQRNWKNGIVTEGWQADDAARDVARKYNLETYFIHRTGHSIAPGEILHSLTVNLDNYETKDTRKILPGLGFSVEPGIYLPEFGVRSEINVYVDPQKGPIVTTEQQDKILTF